MRQRSADETVAPAFPLLVFADAGCAFIADNTQHMDWRARVAVAWFHVDAMAVLLKINAPLLTLTDS